MILVNKERTKRYCTALKTVFTSRHYLLLCSAKEINEQLLPVLLNGTLFHSNPSKQMEMPLNMLPTIPAVHQQEDYTRNENKDR
jgi:hypothetical protein